MDNKYLDALVVALLAFGVLLSIAVIFIGIITAMHKGMSSREGRSSFSLRRTAKKPKKDDEINVVIAAAVAGYLKSEEERRR